MNKRLLLALWISVGSWNCGGGPAVLTSENLPVRRVVLYRNGVGYFERAGQFSGDQLRFQVRQSEVGDFLSSLTVIERENGRVRSVSFEVPEPPEVEEPPPQPPMPYFPGFVPPTQPRPRQERPREPRIDVSLWLDSEDHDMTVAYVVGSPIWRPSYRLVLDERGAVLQAWAIVQNTSGEDWRKVRLSLTTGAPIAFQSDLGTPVTPPRPLVTDTGEVVMAVPQSETTLAQGSEQDEAAADRAQAPASAPTPDAPAESYGAEELVDRERSAARRAPMRAAPSGAASGLARQAPPPPMTANAVQRSLTTMASAAILGDGVTRYDVTGPVTVPDGGSTMVAILSKRVPGESAYLYAPDPGVPTSFMHPFRVARLQNRTGALLERGPVSVLGHGAFLGQGVLEPLPRNATAFVPFAVDRSVAVESSIQGGEAEAKLIRISRETVTVERFATRTTIYKVRNGNSEPLRLYVKHVRMPNADIHEPPRGTELTAQSALVPVQVRARSTAELRVEERTPVERVVEFVSDAAAEAVGLYLRGPAVDVAQGPALRRALEIRRQLADAEHRASQAETEKAQLERNAQETRDNIKAIQNVGSAGDLRNRLVRRLSELDARIAGLTRTIVENQTNRSELRVRLSEALQDVSLEVPSARRASTVQRPRNPSLR